MQSAKLLPFQVVACFATECSEQMSLLRQWASVQLQSLFIHILSSKGSLETVTILSHSLKCPPALHISELGG